MPIKGLTDSTRPAFPRLGKLRKGAPKIDERRPGEELDHWRFTSPRKEIEAAFKDAYGDDPQELLVYLPYAKLDDNFASWKEAWLSGGLQHRCDGETMQIWLGKDGKYHQDPQPCPGGCDEVGRLEVILPDLFRAGFVGYITMETHSLHDLISIQGTLLATIEARGVEDLRGIGFMMRRVETEISTPGADGKRVRRKKWLVKLEPAAAWVASRLEASRVDADVALLGAGDEDIREMGTREMLAHAAAAQSAPEPEEDGVVEGVVVEKPAEKVVEPPTADSIIAALRLSAGEIGKTKIDDSKTAGIRERVSAIAAEAIADTDLNGKGVAAVLANALGSGPNEGLNGMSQAQLRAIGRWLWDDKKKALRPNATTELGVLLSGPLQRSLYERVGGGK